jgi:benzodiazapine receptor
MKIDKTYLLMLIPIMLSFVTQALYWKPDIFSKSPKLFFEPPSYVFGIVWTTIYILLGVYLFRIYTKKEKYFNYLIFVFCINLLLNYIWTPIVMIQMKKKLGVFIIVGMMGTLLSLLVSTTDVISKNLLLPYMTWLIVALLLNIELLRKQVKFNV